MRTVLLLTKILVECIIGRIAEEKAWVSQAKRDVMDVIDAYDASRCQSLNVSASHDLKSAELFVAPAL